ncbi:MAG: DUF2203 domain-containing protein [Acidobacteria bacterium]|nr:DUF2203 domain-containing protein [Acidobacteriota bacterium]
MKLPARRIFSLNDAQQLLPIVKQLTEEAVRRSTAIEERLSELARDTPEHARLAGELEEVVRAWAARLNELSVEPKGLWLVDFDNGDGYYCWQYPEATITHYHGYDDGFAGRIKIT